MTESDRNVVHEVAHGLSAHMVQQFVGATCGLYRQGDQKGPDGLGDGLTRDSTVDDISTEPETPGYERVVLKDGMDPTFDVPEYTGILDALFFVNDDGELLGAFALEQAVVVHDHMTELTPQIWGDGGD